MKKEYAIIDNEGNYLNSPNETGSGNFISLYIKEEAKRQVDIYYRNKGYSVKKLKIK